MQKTYIHEFPHPRVIVHYHPTAGEQFRLDQVQFALAHQVHAIELDLHYRNDRQVVVNHDEATAESPTLEQAIQGIVQQVNGDATVNHDNRQFMLVLEPKENDVRLFSALAQILSGYTAYLSTAVSSGDPPRGITVVITGDYVQQFAAQLSSSQRNQLCIVEGYDYADEIINLSEEQTAFQWVESIQHDRERGRINALHAGADPHLRGTYNVRVWDCQTPTELSRCLASGADAINADHGQVASFIDMIGHQQVHGALPSVSIQGSQALLTWRGAASNDLYMALGTLDAAGLHFSRQILLTTFLGQMPLAVASTAVLSPDQRLLIAYAGTEQPRLWYICGRLTSADRFLTFDGRQQRLIASSGADQHCGNPAAAVGPDGRIIVVYERAENQAIWYSSGFLDAAGELVAQEYCLSAENTRRGTRPAIAIGAQNRVIVTYQGADSATLWYVAGTIDAAGKIIGTEFALTDGFAPSVAFDSYNRVIITYQRPDTETIGYVSGTLDQDGRISGRESMLTEGAERRGRHPTIASDAAGAIVILYEGLDDQTLRYFHGQLDASGRLVGQESVLEIGVDRR